MEFKEPKVEIIKLNINDVVFASPGGSATETCISSGNVSSMQCPDTHVG